MLGDVRGFATAGLTGFRLARMMEVSGKHCN